MTAANRRLLIRCRNRAEPWLYGIAAVVMIIVFYSHLAGMESLKEWAG